MTDIGVGSWPARRARITPDAVALRQGDRALTYAELAGRVDALAAALAGRGVSTGDRVAYLGANDMATFETFFAAGRLGAIFVPLNTRLTAAELGLLLADCAPSVLVHGTEMSDVVAAVGELLSSRLVAAAVAHAGMPGTWVDARKAVITTDDHMSARPLAVETNAALGRSLGRDHHPHAYTMWMAGGGVKPGLQYGLTDELGYNVVENPVHVHDLQATILHLLGLDHERLTYRYAGRDFRLTDIHGKLVKGILA